MAKRKPESELPLTFVDRIATLSKRERQVFEPMRQGKSSAEIAVLLDINLKTVETHRSHINAKLGVHSPVEFLIKCHEAGLGPNEFTERSRPGGVEGGQYVDVRVSLRVPSDWDLDRVHGYVASRLHFPRGEEQKHRDGCFLPYVSSLGARNLRPMGADGAPGKAMLHFTGRLDEQELDGPIIDNFQPFTYNPQGMPEDGFSIGAHYPLGHLLEAFAGKLVSIEVDEVATQDNDGYEVASTSELGNLVPNPVETPASEAAGGE